MSARSIILPLIESPFGDDMCSVGYDSPFAFWQMSITVRATGDYYDGSSIGSKHQSHIEESCNLILLIRANSHVDPLTLFDEISKYLANDNLSLDDVASSIDQCCDRWISDIDKNIIQVNFDALTHEYVSTNYNVIIDTVTTPFVNEWVNFNPVNVIKIYHCDVSSSSGDDTSSDRDDDF